MSSPDPDETSTYRTQSRIGESAQELWVTMRWEDLQAAIHQLAQGDTGPRVGVAGHATAEPLAAVHRGATFEARIPVADGPGRTHYVKVIDIDWFEAQSQYVRLHSGSRSFLARAPGLSIANLAMALDPLDFFRVHRSHIVNLCSVIALEVDDTGRHFVILTGERQVPVSHQNWKCLRTLLSRFDGNV